jgi:hypothetical protein
MRNPQRPISVNEIHHHNGHIVTQILYPKGVERFGLRRQITETRYERVGKVEKTVDAVLERLNLQ